MSDPLYPDVGFASLRGSSSGRFSEPAKFLPIGFVCAIIAILWGIYMEYHCIPLIQHPDTYKQGMAQTSVFNFLSLMLVVCYVKCIATHPGTIPGKDHPAHTEWDYVAQDQRKLAISASGAQETKRSGDRRHCKWCSKYKPDRCHHCRVCRMCILRMDHHCPWIYNCVGFHNHKYFFLLLLWSTIAIHMIIWSMHRSLSAAIGPDAEFRKMFMLLFGQTLAVFMGIAVSGFFCFHIWLLRKGMTTVEFCEKSLKHNGYDSCLYGRGLYGNIQAVLGENPLLWCFPYSPPSGDGLTFITEEAPLLCKSPEEEPLLCKSKAMEAGHHPIETTIKFTPARGQQLVQAGTGESYTGREYTEAGGSASADDFGY